jgi:hypothetical protein
MVATFTGDSARNMQLEMGVGGITFTDISGDAASIQVSGGERASGEAYDFEKDTAGVTQGKRAPLEITVRVHYKEGATNAAVLVRGYYEAGTRVNFRYAPLDSGGVGHSWFSTDPDAIVTQFGYPGGEAASGDPIDIEFVLKTESLTESVKTS